METDGSVRGMIEEIHRMASELTKMKRDKKHRLQARLSVDPTARGPGRPRKPVLFRVNGQQEFINNRGRKVVIPCLQRESRCRSQDHVQRIMMAYARLKEADVKVTVKNIRLLGIGAGTFIDNRPLLPKKLLDELSPRPKEKLAPLEEKKENIVRHQHSDVDELLDREDTALKTLISMHEVTESEDDDFFIEGQAGFEQEQSEQESVFDEFMNVNCSYALKALLRNENFRHAIWLVDGVFDDWVPPRQRHSVRALALGWTEEVAKQRRLHGLPVVNMRAARPMKRYHFEMDSE